MTGHTRTGAHTTPTRIKADRFKHIGNVVDRCTLEARIGHDLTVVLRHAFEEGARRLGGIVAPVPRALWKSCMTGECLKYIFHQTLQCTVLVTFPFSTGRHRHRGKHPKRLLQPGHNVSSQYTAPFAWAYRPCVGCPAALTPLCAASSRGFQHETGAMGIHRFASAYRTKQLRPFCYSLLGCLPLPEFHIQTPGKILHPQMMAVKTRGMASRYIKGFALALALKFIPLIATMQPKLLLSLAYFTAVCVAGPIDTFTRLFSKRAGSDGTFVDADFIDPRKGGGSLLNRSGSGGEPLNVGLARPSHKQAF